MRRKHKTQVSIGILCSIIFLLLFGLVHTHPPRKFATLKHLKQSIIS